MINYTGSVKIEAIGNRAPQVFISHKAFDVMSYITKEVDTEIGWFASVSLLAEPTGTPHYLIEDVFIPEQEVHGTNTDITEEGLLKLAQELIGNGEEEAFNKIRLWGHSHVNMSTSASSQDDDQFEELYNNSPDFYIRLIMNKRGEFSVDFADMVAGVAYNNVPLRVENEHALEAELDAIIEERVTEVVVLTSDKNNWGTGSKVGTMEHGDGNYRNWSQYHTVRRAEAERLEALEDIDLCTNAKERMETVEYWRTQGVFISKEDY